MNLDSDPRFPAMKILACTLPGAALWSIPIGGFLLRYSGTGFSLASLPDPLALAGKGVVILLIPVSAFCSIWAMELCSKTTTYAGLSVLLMLFNTVTAVLSVISSVFGFIALVSMLF